MARYYILNESREPVRVGNKDAWERAIALYRREDVSVGSEEISDGVVVYTRFTGNVPGNIGPSYPFVTFVSTDYGCERRRCYPSWSSAEWGHQRTVTAERNKIANQLKPKLRRFRSER